MGFHAMRFPEGREEEVEYAEKISDAGTGRNQRIHIEIEMLQLFPSVHEKFASEKEDGDGCRNQDTVADDFIVLEGHTSDHDWNQKNPGSDTGTFELGVMVFPYFFSFRSSFFLFFNQQVITGISDGLTYFLHIAFFAVKSDLGQISGKVDGRFFHAFYCFQGLVHFGGACGASHTYDRKGT